MSRTSTPQIIGAALAALCFIGSAHALTITPSDGTINVSRWEGNQTGQNQIDAAIALFIGSSTEQYKMNVGDGSDSGNLAGSYTTTFELTPTDPSKATIKYDGGAVLQNTRYALVKDGNQEPAWYLFDLTALGWDGTADLIFENFWPSGGAISHVALYGGSDSSGPNVPDNGNTIALLGCSLVAVEMARRLMRA